MKKILGAFLFPAVLLLAPVSAQALEPAAQTNADAVSKTPDQSCTDRASGSTYESTPARSVDSRAPFKVKPQDCASIGYEAWRECRRGGGSFTGCAQWAVLMTSFCEAGY